MLTRDCLRFSGLGSMPCTNMAIIPLPKKQNKQNQTPDTNIAAASTVGLQAAAVSAHAPWRPASKWLLPSSARLPRDGSWWACSLSARHRHGRRYRSDYNSRHPVVAGPRSFLFLVELGKGVVNGEREERASVPAPDGEDG